LPSNVNSGRQWHPRQNTETRRRERDRERKREREKEREREKKKRERENGSSLEQAAGKKRLTDRTSIKSTTAKPEAKTLWN
jgi:hypothetical protein